MKESNPRKWRGYLLGIWQCYHRKYPALDELYESKLIIAQNLLRQWVNHYPALNLPVTFDNWYTQTAFCRFLDQTLKLAYVGTLAESDVEGLDQYQLRDFSGIQRHVAVVYSLLRAAQHDPDLRDRLQRQLKVKLEGSLFAWRRATQAQALWSLGLFILAQP